MNFISLNRLALEVSARSCLCIEIQLFLLYNFADNKIIAHFVAQYKSIRGFRTLSIIYHCHKLLVSEQSYAFLQKKIYV